MRERMLFVRQHSAPGGFWRREDPSSYSANASIDVVTSSVISKEVDRPATTSWHDSDGSWHHRSSPAPYQNDVRHKQLSLPRVLVPRLERPRMPRIAPRGSLSSSGSTSSVPTLPLKAPHLSPGRAEDVLGERLQHLQEIFARSSPQAPPLGRRALTAASPRLQELAKPKPPATAAVGQDHFLSDPDLMPPKRRLRRKNHVPATPQRLTDLWAKNGRTADRAEQAAAAPAATSTAPAAASSKPAQRRAEKAPAPREPSPRDEAEPAEPSDASPKPGEGCEACGEARGEAIADDPSPQPKTMVEAPQEGSAGAEPAGNDEPDPAAAAAPSAPEQTADQAARAVQLQAAYRGHRARDQCKALRAQRDEERDQQFDGQASYGADDFEATSGFPGEAAVEDSGGFEDFEQTSPGLGEPGALAMTKESAASYEDFEGDGEGSEGLAGSDAGEQFIFEQDEQAGEQSFFEQDDEAGSEQDEEAEEGSGKPQDGGSAAGDDCYSADDFEDEG